MPTQNPQSPPPAPAGSRPGGATPERVREQLRLFLVLLLGLVVVTQLELPFRLGGLLLGLGGGWVGIRLLISMTAVSRSGAEVRGWPSVIIGLGLTVVLVLVLTVQAVFYPVMSERERCLAEANTIKAQDSCDRRYQDRLDDLTGDLRRRAGDP